jgi:hypothetical protein
MLVASAVLALGLAAAPADTVSFRFAWPESLDASIEYRGSKTRPGGVTREFRLNGRLVARTKGDQIRIRWEDWRSVGGEEPDPLIEAAGRITTVVSRSGEFVRVDDVEPALKAVTAMFDGAPAEARPMLERLAKMGPALLTKGANEIKRKAVAGVQYLFDSHAWVQAPQLSRHLERDHGAVANDQQAGDVNCGHDVAICRAGRREHAERAHASVEPGLGLDLDELWRAMRVPGSGLRDEIRLP